MKGAAALSLATAWLLSACAAPAGGGLDGRRFDFSRDTFAYANELYWSYEFGAEPGATRFRGREEPVEYGQRCIAIARAARQFFRAARFEPGAPPLGEAGYRERIRKVLETDPRAERPVEAPIAIPGFADLRGFSRAHETLLKELIGGLLTTYLQRGNWRLIFPFPPSSQRATARELREGVARGDPPIVHVANFPRIDVNHALLVFEAEETPLAVRFSAYDPNDVEHPVSLVFERATATFHLERTPYFSGGPVKVYEIYRGPLF